MWNTIAYTNSHSYRNGHCYGYCNSNLHADTYSDGHIYTDRDSDSNGNGYSHSHSYSYSYSYSNCDGYGGATPGSACK